MDGSTYSPGSGGTAGHVVEPAGEMGPVMALAGRLSIPSGVLPAAFPGGSAGAFP